MKKLDNVIKFKNMNDVLLFFKKLWNLMNIIDEYFEYNDVILFNFLIVYGEY